MKKVNTILSMVSLSLTSFLLVFLLFAWYATNKTASVEETTGRVAALPGLVEHVDYYNFSSNAGSSYTVETHITDSGTCDMQKFSYTSGKPTIYYIRIQLNANTKVNQLKFISSATAFVGFSTRSYPDPENAGKVITRNDANGVIAVDNKHLSLSSAIKFTLLGVTDSATSYVNAGNTSATFSNLNSLTWSSFTYGTNGGMLASNVGILNTPISSSDNAQYIHILLDYDVDHLNEFYGNNLTNQDVLNQGNGPEFSNKDFIIYLLS